jgi:hypothetical protein
MSAAPASPARSASPRQSAIVPTLSFSRFIVFPFGRKSCHRLAVTAAAPSQ